MTNHYYLLIETLRPTLSKRMREVNGVYTRGVNYSHGPDPRVFLATLAGVHLPTGPVHRHPQRPIDRDLFIWSEKSSMAFI